MTTESDLKILQLISQGGPMASGHEPVYISPEYAIPQEDPRRQYLSPERVLHGTEIVEQCGHPGCTKPYPCWDHTARSDAWVDDSDIEKCPRCSYYQCCCGTHERNQETGVWEDHFRKIAPATTPSWISDRITSLPTEEFILNELRSVAGNIVSVVGEPHICVSRWEELDCFIRVAIAEGEEDWETIIQLPAERATLRANLVFAGEFLFEEYSKKLGGTEPPKLELPKPGDETFRLVSLPARDSCGEAEKAIEAIDRSLETGEGDPEGNKPSSGHKVPVISGNKYSWWGFGKPMPIFEAYPMSKIADYVSANLYHCGGRPDINISVEHGCPDEPDGFTVFYLGCKYYIRPKLDLESFEDFTSWCKTVVWAHG